MKSRIKELRELKGLTQKQLSARSGVSLTVINGLETGCRVRCSLSTLRALADALNVDTGELIIDMGLQ